MRWIVPFVAAFFISCESTGQTQFEELRLLSYAQLQIADSTEFDLSGLIQVGNRYYVNADGKTNNFIYEIKLQENQWQFVAQMPLEIPETIDLEALDYHKGYFYVANEKSGKIYRKQANSALGTLAVAWGEEDPSSWKNAGWEGLTIDEERDILYMIKERQPRKIFAIDLKSLQVTDSFNIPETESNDFADAHFEKGFLYLLERNGNFIAKVNPTTHEVVAKVSYRETCSHPRGKLYAPSKYGMAEALLFTPTEIWIGLDNNGIPVSDYGREKYGLTGKAPVILKFNRPKGF
jgi:hypothetical protein